MITTCVDWSFSVSFHAHVSLRSEEREDGCGPVDEGWNSCWREEKLPSKFREMTKKALTLGTVYARAQGVRQSQLS